MEARVGYLLRLNMNQSYVNYDYDKSDIQQGRRIDKLCIFK